MAYLDCGKKPRMRAFLAALRLPAPPLTGLLCAALGWGLAGPCAAMEQGLWQFDITREGVALGVVPLGAKKTVRVCVTGSALEEVTGLAIKNSCALRRRSTENETTILDGECRQAGVAVPVTINIAERGRRHVDVRLATRKNPWVRLTDHTVGQWVSACPAPTATSAAPDEAT